MKVPLPAAEKLRAVRQDLDKLAELLAVHEHAALASRPQNDSARKRVNCVYLNKVTAHPFSGPRFPLVLSIYPLAEIGS